MPRRKTVKVDWVQRVYRWRVEVRQQLQAQGSRALTRVAEDIRDEVRRRIYDGQVGGPSLSPDWAARKEEEGLDPRKLIAEEVMVQNIQIAAGYVEGDNVRAGVGIPDLGAEGAKEKGRRPEYLPLVHEYGTDDGMIPERPVWRPTMQAIRRKSPTIKEMLAGKTFSFRFRGNR